MSTEPKKIVRLLRLPQVIGPDGPIPVGKSTWCAGVKVGRFPKPIKLGPRIAVWRSDDIEALVESGSWQEGEA